MSESQSPMRTYGQKAAGVSFNPGGLKEVNELKQMYSEIIDYLNSTRAILKVKPIGEQDIEDGERIRLLSVAITEAQTAQMWAVKAVTWELK